MCWKIWKFTPAPLQSVKAIIAGINRNVILRKLCTQNKQHLLNHMKWNQTIFACVWPIKRTKIWCSSFYFCLFEWMCVCFYAMWNFEWATMNSLEIVSKTRAYARIHHKHTNFLTKHTENTKGCFHSLLYSEYETSVKSN